MSQILIAPDESKPLYPSVFLGGGISGCPDWQSGVCDNLRYENITVFNPRREHFDISDRTLTQQQIQWEFKRLERCDIFSMFFCEGESVQPICLYELGRNIVRMQNRFPSSWKHRIVVTVEPRYKRADDVFWQSLYATNCFVFARNGYAFEHSLYISRAIKDLRDLGEIE